MAREETVRNLLTELIDMIDNGSQRDLDRADEIGTSIIKLLEQEPKTGHWVAIDEEPHEDYECDKCGYVVSTFTENIEPHTEYKYCPNCGVKMAESEDKE